VRGRLVRRRWEGDPSRYAPARHRRACDYATFEPAPLGGDEFGLPAATTGVVSDAERAIAALNAAPTRALDPLARLLLRTESIASSKVEGLQADPRALARAEARGDAGAALGPDTRDVLANIDAMQLAIEETSVAGGLTVDGIRAVHAALTAGHPGAIAGRVRTEQNWIGGNDHTPCGADFVPPDPEGVPALLEDLVAFSSGEELPPLVQAAIAHAQFETIHPFADGNGRTGRALVHVILRRRGLAPVFVPPVSVVLAARRDAYIAALTAFREGRVARWIEHFAVAAARAAQLAGAYLDAVARLQDRWRAQLREAVGPRADAAAWDLIDVLPAHPVVSVPIGVTATGRTRPAVNTAVGMLARAGVLHPLSAARRNRAWEADGLLDLIARLEAGELPA
jgi:Fic family protein